MTEEQFIQAVAQYGDMVFRVAYSCLKNRSDAEDVMQETLLKLYRQKGEFAGEEHLRRWLIRVAMNQARSLFRSSWFRRTVPLEEQLDQPVFDRPEESELFAQVMSLPQKYRLVLYLHYYEGYSVREVAELLRANLSTVQTWLMRARGLLQKSYQEAWSRDESKSISGDLFPTARL